MKLKLKKNQDFWAGVMFILVGTVAFFIALNYRFGSTLRMGPGYFPTALSGIMVLFGMIIMLNGLRKSMQIPENLSIRALIMIPISMCLYAFMLKVVGFVPALIVLIFVASASKRKFNFKEVLLLTVILVTLTWGLFIYGLGLPYAMFVKFW